MDKHNITEYCIVKQSQTHFSFSLEVWKKNHFFTYQAKHPTNATNLSKSFAPNELITVVNKTNANLKRFFIHLTCMLPFPLLVNRPFSIIRMAGKSCNGIDKRMASAYKSCTLRAQKIKLNYTWKKSVEEGLTVNTILLLGSKFTSTTVRTSLPNVR